MEKPYHGARILISLAHPDDEAFGMGGAIARYVNEGADVYLICSTNGDVGTVAEKYLNGYDSIADLRLAELNCASEALGFKAVFTLGYRDSGMPGTADNEHPRALIAAPPDEVTGQIVRVIRQVRPQVVVTFDPFGGYGHPDHIRMCETTTRAFHDAADPGKYPEHLSDGLQPYQPQRLYYQTFPRAWLKPVVAIMPLLGQNPAEFGRNKDIDLREIVEHSFPVHARVDATPYKAIAEQARDCHASQIGTTPEDENRRKTLFEMVGAFRAALSRPKYTFMRAYPPIESGERVERDLLEHVSIQ